MVLVGAKLEQCLSEALKEELSRQREGETSIQAEGMRVQRCWGGVDGGGAGGPCGLTQWLRGRVTEMSLGGLGGVGRRPGGERWGPWGATGGHPSSSEFTAALNSKDYCNSLGGDRLKRQEAGRR